MPTQPKAITGRAVRRLLVATMAVLAAVSLPAQQKPSFSGRWVVVSPEKSAGQESIVTHDATSLAVERVPASRGRKQVYAIDGLERRTTLPLQGGEVVMLTRAAWDGDRVVITTHLAYPNGMKTQSKEVWSIDANGRLMIDYSESGPRGQPGPSVTLIHTRKS
jgi:hypothetical protein